MSFFEFLRLRYYRTDSGMKKKSMNTGTFYAVSVGPGDPELMTIKTIKTIEFCNVIAYPVTQSGQSIAKDIAAFALDMSGKEELPLAFSMGREADYESAAAQIEEYLKAGDDVALLNLGDVSLYSTASRILRILKANGRKTIVVPGVPSFCAAAARLGVALAEADEPLHIIPDANKKALEMSGTKVFMKSGKRLPELVNAIKANGQRAMAVKNCGMPQEEVYPELSQISSDPAYFITVIVKK